MAGNENEEFLETLAAQAAQERRAKMPMRSLDDFALRKLAELDRELRKQKGACQTARENRSAEA
jgi:hypothetical protein